MLTPLSLMFIILKQGKEQIEKVQKQFKDLGMDENLIPF